MDLGIIARRLRKDIYDLYGYNAVVHVLSASGIRKSTRYLVRVAKDGEALARQTGLLDMRGARCAACPPRWSGQRRRRRGGLARAFLAHGSLTEPDARRPWRSAARVRRPRSPWWGPPAGSG